MKHTAIIRVLAVIVSANIMTILESYTEKVSSRINLVAKLKLILKISENLKFTVTSKNFSNSVKIA